MLKVAKDKPKYLEEELFLSRPFAKRFIYDRGNGRKTAYLHYVDGMEIWERNPNLWKGWQLMVRVLGEQEVC